MNRQIKKFFPHQNGKVTGVIVAIGTMPMFLLMAIPMFFMTPDVDSAGNPIQLHFQIFFLLMPFFYLVFTYISVVAGCWIYNFMFKFIGGFEFVFEGENDTHTIVPPKKAFICKDCNIEIEEKSLSGSNMICPECKGILEECNEPGQA